MLLCDLKYGKQRFLSLNYFHKNISIFFEQQHGEPVLYKDGIGQYAEDNQLVKEFVCKYDCIKQLKMSDKTLNKALDNTVLYSGFYFKRIGIKLKVI